MESFVLKVPILGPHLPSYKRNVITRAGFTIIWHSTSTSVRRIFERGMGQEIQKI